VEAGADVKALIAPGGTPSRPVAARELVREVLRRLSPEERRLVEWRGQGRAWEEIAARLDGRAEALGKKLTRALDRVTAELGVDETGPG
jgi:DNA-directed RNA polymerase specialized sigma24 family protein